MYSKDQQALGLKARKESSLESLELINDERIFRKVLLDVWQSSDDNSEQINNTPLEFTSLSKPDVVTDSKDYLDIETEARAFARLIAATSTAPPLSIGIFGRWGSGKSFFMNKVSKAIEEFNSDVEANGFYNNIVQIDFNAWHYMESNVWASLVEVIFSSLEQAITSTKESSDSISLIEKLSSTQKLRVIAIEDLSKKLSRLHAAKNVLKNSQEKLNLRKPDGPEVWSSVYDSLKEVLLDYTQQIERLGHNCESMTGTMLREISDDIEARKNILSEIKIEALQPKLLLFLALFFFVSMFFSLGEKSELLVPLSGSMTWLAYITRNAKYSLLKLQTLKIKIEEERHEQVRKISEQYKQAKVEIEHATRQLEFAEIEVEKANQALANEKPGAKLAAFITERAASDDYNRHLGVIASIRRDFEQLAALINLKEKADLDNEVEAYQASLNTKIQELKEQYEKLKGEGGLDDDGTLFMFKEAIDRLERSMLKNTSDTPRLKRIVLKIDDLDRCPSKKVAEVLQAIHLFLNFPLFVIMVCVDERWMSSSLIKEFGGLVDGKNGATTSDYLEKIFQIPYWTRPMDAYACNRFAHALMSESEIESGKDPLPSPDDSSSRSDEPSSGSDESSSGSDDSSSRSDEPSSGSDESSSGSDDSSSRYDEPSSGSDEPSPSSDELSPGPYDSSSEAKQIKVQHFSPLRLEEEEKEILAHYSSLAGDTPRRTLRLVRVYMILKTSITHFKIFKYGGEVLNVDQNLITRCLIFQLAIATRIDKVGEIYFRALNEFEQSRNAPNLENDELVKELREAIRLESKSKNFGLELSEFAAAESMVLQLSALMENEVGSKSEVKNKTIKTLLSTKDWATRYTFSQK